MLGLWLIQEKKMLFSLRRYLVLVENQLTVHMRITFCYMFIFNLSVTLTDIDDCREREKKNVAIIYIYIVRHYDMISPCAAAAVQPLGYRPCVSRSAGTLCKTNKPRWRKMSIYMFVFFSSSVSSSIGLYCFCSYSIWLLLCVVIPWSYISCLCLNE